MTAPGNSAVVQDNIDLYGQHLFGVFATADEPDILPFVYTIGNAVQGLPELLLIGNFDAQTIGHVLNLLGDMQRGAGVPLEGEISLGGSFPVRVRVASDSAKSEYTIQAGQYLGRENYSVLQVLLCDKKGVFPGEPGCEPFFDVPLV